MEELFIDLLSEFELDPERCEIVVIGSGHIHDTYLVKRCKDDLPPLILQRINHYVFKDVKLLMNNMELVCSHIALQNRQKGLDSAANGIVLLETIDGKSYIGNEEDGYWRMFWFIEDQESYEIAPDEKIAYQGGIAIAEFQRMLTGLDPEQIGDTIPRFHDLRMRMDQFRESLKKNDAERISKAAGLIDFVDIHQSSALEILDYSMENDFPIRLTHNDTKFNNILFNNSGEVTCMIDLDTVMKGYYWYDIGDVLRTCASIAPEDEPDVNKIGYRVDVANALIDGFLSVARSYLTDAEMSVIKKAPEFFTFMQGVRFLTDYLNGDVYYKTTHPEHNFERARAQFQLMKIQKGE